MHTLVDVSSWNHVTDLSVVDGVIFKATEGATWSDPTFVANVKLAVKQGKPWTAYHFGRVTSDAVAQARRFHAAVMAIGTPDFPLVLDHEANDGHSAAETSAWARAFCAELEQLAGRKPIVYTYDAFARAGHCDGLEAYPLWYARYIKGATWDSIRRIVPPPWTPDQMILWQCGQTQIPGITPGDGPGVDFNQTPDLTLLTGGDDMPLTDADRAAIAAEVWSMLYDPKDPHGIAALRAISAAIWLQTIGAGDQGATAAVFQQRAGVSAPAAQAALNALPAQVTAAVQAPLDALAGQLATAVTDAIQSHAVTTGTPLPDGFAQTVADAVAADIAARMQA